MGWLGVGWVLSVCVVDESDVSCGWGGSDWMVGGMDGEP